MIIGILILFLTNYFSGYFIYKYFFKKVNLLEKIILPQSFSLITTPIMFTLLYLIAGFNLAIYTLPLLIIFTFIISIKFRQKNYKLKITKALLLAILILAIIVILQTYLLAFLRLQKFTDITLHVSIANEIKNSRNLPPDNACLYGGKQYYQWFPDLMVAIMAIYSGYSVFEIYPFFIIYVALLLYANLLLLGYSIFKDTNLAVMSMVILSVAPPGYSVILVVLFFYTFIKFVQSKSERFAILAGMICSSLIYFHALSFIFSCLFLFSFCLYKLINFNKKELKQLILLIIPLVFVLPYFLLVKEVVGSFFLFEPFVGLIYNYIKIFNILLLILPFGIIKVIKNRNEIGIDFLLLLITLFVFVNTFVMQKGPDINRFVNFMFFPIGLLALFYLKDKKPFTRNLIFFVIVIFLLYPILNDLINYYSEQNIFAQNIFMSDEYAISVWIRQNTNVNDTILASPISLYTAISERKVLICDPSAISSHFLDVKKNFVDEILMYTYPSRDLIEKYNISYVVLGDLEYDFFKKYNLAPYNFSKSTAFTPVFNFGNYTIFKITNAQILPQFVNKSIEENLNFTSYSRWWSL